jgi:hypothetical protein
MHHEHLGIKIEEMATCSIRKKEAAREIERRATTKREIHSGWWQHGVVVVVGGGVGCCGLCPDQTSLSTC